LKGLHDIEMISLLPDGSTVQFGDAWKYRKLEDGSFVPRYGDWIYKAWTERFPDDLHYKYLESGGKEGKAWDETCFRFTESGFHFFRNDWSKEAIYLALKYGPNARAHNQPDNGTFSLSAFGRDFMTDSGSYVYRSEDPEEQNWRKWFRRSASHQTLTLDNKDIQPDPEYLYWRNEEDLTVAVIENQSYEDLSHRRTVLFIDKSFFVILDEAKGNATGDIRIHFQLDSNELVYADNGLSAFTDFGTGANLLLKTFPQSNSVVMEEEEGWVSYLYKHKQERPAFSYRVKKSGDDPVTYLTVIVPVDGSVSKELISTLNAEVLKVSENKYEYTISMEGKTWNIEVDTGE